MHSIVEFIVNHPVKAALMLVGAAFSVFVIMFLWMAAIFIGGAIVNRRKSK